MSEPLRLVVHVAEPWDFARANDGLDMLAGQTEDHDGDGTDWEIALDSAHVIGEDRFERVIVSPRMVGEDLRRVHDGFTFTPVNIRHLGVDEDGEPAWHYTMVGSIALERQEG